MSTCTKCNKGEMRRSSKQKNSQFYCTNSDCSESFYQKVIMNKEITVVPHSKFCRCGDCPT